MGPVEHFQKDDNFCQLSVITMRLSTKYITKVLLLLIGVLGSGGVGPINNHNLNMVNFLRSQGLHALSERFLAEEIEVEQIARLTDQDLISVGVTTIGGRIRIRSAAANWAPTLVSCIVLSLLQMIVFYVF